MRVTFSPENQRFLKKVESLSGEDILLCFQCGECTACCPMAHEMDILPSTLIRLVQLGQEDVLKSNTIWVCSSCLDCFTRCPLEIDLAKIIEALRQMNLRKNVDYVRLNEIPKEEIRRIPQIALISNLRKFTS